MTSPCCSADPDHLISKHDAQVPANSADPDIYPADQIIRFLYSEFVSKSGEAEEDSNRISETIENDSAAYLAAFDVKKETFKKDFKTEIERRISEDEPTDNLRRAFVSGGNVSIGEKPEVESQQHEMAESLRELYVLKQLITHESLRADLRAIVMSEKSSEIQVVENVFRPQNLNQPGDMLWELNSPDKKYQKVLYVYHDDNTSHYSVNHKDYPMRKWNKWAQFASQSCTFCDTHAESGQATADEGAAGEDKKQCPSCKCPKVRTVAISTGSTESSRSSHQQLKDMLKDRLKVLLDPATVPSAAPESDYESDHKNGDEQTRKEIKAEINALEKGDWHLNRFENRYKDEDTKKLSECPKMEEFLRSRDLSLKELKEPVSALKAKLNEFEKLDWSVKGYQSLKEKDDHWILVDSTETSKDVIDRDLKEVHSLLSTGLYNEVRYKGDGHGGLGSKSFVIGSEVKDYIVENLTKYHGLKPEVIERTDLFKLQVRKVKFGITITQLVEIREKTHDFVVEFMAIMQWSAHRDDEKWRPVLRWANARSIEEVDAPVITPEITTAGVEVQFVQHYIGVFMQSFPMRTFPVDTQKLHIYMISPRIGETQVEFVPLYDQCNQIKPILPNKSNQCRTWHEHRNRNTFWDHLEFPGQTWKVHQINQADRLSAEPVVRVPRSPNCLWC